MTSFTTANVSALPVVAATTSRLVNLLEKFVVPVAAAAAGFIGGKPLVFELAEFLSVFVPGIQTMENWIFTASKSGTVTVSVALVITGVVLMSSAVIADRLISQFLGLGRLTMVLRRGVVAFLFGAGVRALAESFAPFKGAIEAFSETSIQDTTTTIPTPPSFGGVTPAPIVVVPTKPAPTPPEPFADTPAPTGPPVLTPVPGDEPAPRERSPRRTI